jgi:hypothetical protein
VSAIRTAMPWAVKLRGGKACVRRQSSPSPRRWSPVDRRARTTRAALPPPSRWTLVQIPACGHFGQARQVGNQSWQLLQCQIPAGEGPCRVLSLTARRSRATASQGFGVVCTADQRRGITAKWCRAGFSFFQELHHLFLGQASFPWHLLQQPARRFVRPPQPLWMPSWSDHIHTSRLTPPSAARNLG